MPSPPGDFPRRRHSFGFLVLAAALALGAGSEARAQQVVIGADLILRVDDERFFPIGLLQLGNDDYPDWNDRIRQSGANFVWDIGFAFADSAPSCSAVRDSAEATGYKLMIGSFDTWGWDDPNTPELEVAQAMYPADSLLTLGQCFASSSAMIGFANRDEPVWAMSQGVLGDVDSLHIHDTYAQLQAAFPEHIVGMNLAPVHPSGDSALWVADLQGYRDAADVLMHASYPYPPGPGTCSPKVVLGQPDCVMDRLPDGLDTIAQHVKRPDQPLWAVIQAHKGIPRKEARWEAYISVIHGATGILWAGHNWTHPLGGGAQSWDVISGVISEVAELHDVLVRRKIAMVSSASADLDVLGRFGAESGIAYIFAASRRGSSGDMTVDLGGVPVSWAEVVFENRWVQIVNSQITDHFQDYEAHVYRLDVANDPSPTSVELSDDAWPETGFHVRVLSNPARDGTRVRFRAPAEASVDFAVYDVTGRLLAQPEAVRTSATEGWLTWDGRGAGGRAAPAGIYFLRGSASTGERVTERIVLLR